MIIIIGMKSVIQDEILDVAFGLSLHANALGKGMNPSVLSQPVVDIY